MQHIFTYCLSSFFPFQRFGRSRLSTHFRIIRIVTQVFGFPAEVLRVITIETLTRFEHRPKMGWGTTTQNMHSHCRGTGRVSILSSLCRRVLLLLLLQAAARSTKSSFLQVNSGQQVQWPSRALLVDPALQQGDQGRRTAASYRTPCAHAGTATITGGRLSPVNVCVRDIDQIDPIMACVSTSTPRICHLMLFS